ncbi:hypothetical protein CY35_07G069900 [Sphagnum magellanicum]|uniref:Uncharacterized protein n=1 Tax=Sphagnum magellanicum TaxID=128215 RepID=A0ACB8HLR5_9BRYO|nr:hypothetical protein CY35_07G069900 [Sphagnum magellanicum]
MSGATLAAGRWGSKRHGEGGYDERNSRSGAGGLGGMMGSLRVIELQLVAFIVVFSASGLVPVADLLFPIFITLYAFLLSAAIFPSYKGGDLQVFKGNRLFQGYVIVGTSVGLFLPLAFVLGGFARGNQQAVRSATPHLFLLSCQILTENLVNGLQIFSLPVRVLLPILYSARRIFSLSDWVQSTFTLSTLPQDPTFEAIAWFWFERGLVVANAVYYVGNLFGFLIPFFLPRAFEQYFEQKKKHEAEEIERKSHLPTPAAPPNVENKKAK